MYCIVFNGSVLSGHDPARVRAAVAERLRLGAGDVERLFSGQRTILKKGVPENTARRYIAILRELGMHAMLSPMQDPARATGTPSLNLKVVFWGQTLPGFTRDGVMEMAAARLRLPAGQVARIFSGSKVVLKRGLDSGLAVRYRSELAQIGMRVELESDQPRPAQTGLAPARREQGEAAFSRILDTQFELPARSFDADEAPASGTAVPALPPARAAKTPPHAPVRPAGIRERLSCPHCGHRQTERRQCVVCGGPIIPPRAAPPDALANMPAVKEVLAQTPAAPPDAGRAGWTWVLMGIFVLGVCVLWRLR